MFKLILIYIVPVTAAVMLAAYVLMHLPFRKKATGFIIERKQAKP